MGRQDFVETVLARVLVKDEPAIGITADFGEGKSSVLALIQASIDKGAGAIAVPFRAWLPGNEETFVDSLFETATAAIRTRYFIPSWRSTFRRYGSAVLGVIPKSWALIRDFLSADSQANQINELASLFSRLPVRIVFLLDEIDRMHEEELTVLLKILRGAPELSNVSYVCAFNKEALARLVSAGDPEFGRRYLDKFFPVQLPLPRIDGDLREYLFSDRISELLEREQVFHTESAKKRFDDLRNDLWYNALATRLNNFRSIGQLIRTFDDSLHVLKSEVNIFDLLVIECLRMLLPSTYEFVYQNGRYFHDSPKGIERWNRAQREIDQEAGKKAASVALDAYFERLTSNDYDLSRNLLSSIFPHTKAYFREKSKGLGPLMIHDLEKERRISDPNFFPRYFSYAVPETMFGETEMEQFITAIRDADEQAIGHLIDATMPETGRNDLRRLDFLRRIRARISQIPDGQARLLATALAGRTSEMLSDHVAYLVIKGIVLSIAARFQNDSGLQQVLQEVVRNAGSDRFASDIVHSSVSERREADEISNWDNFDSAKLKIEFGRRMRQQHHIPVHGNLVSNPDAALAFSRWKHYIPEDAPYIIEFLRSAFDFSIQNVGQFLVWMLPGNIVYQGGAIKFIETFYPSITDIIQRLKSAEEHNVTWSSEQMAAIKRFWDLMKEEGSASQAEIVE